MRYSMASKEKKAFSFSSLLGQNSSKQQRRNISSSPGDLTPSSTAATSSPTTPSSRFQRSVSRPISILLPSQPPALPDVNPDIEPELQPIISYLAAHSQKLYTDGYFLKLTDLTPDGKPSPDREWVECYGQLVGTVLSLWDASALDAAGPDAEITPTYLNLTDAQIKMIEMLPTRSAEVPPLKNVLSISTASKNRYLLHFLSPHSLTQWTAGIRLAMYELAALQEAYTGALVAGKGKTLGCIQEILERTRYKHEDWVRVRFGAGEPWQRCWAVISPPDEKEYQKQKKTLKKQAKKTGTQPIPLLKGNIKLYPTKKTKRVTPIATITNAYACYAVYPQAKALIEKSTLVKLEGTIMAHDPENTREGFVFIMPDLHAAVSGFETLLRWLFPSFDTFALYGRPGSLIADTMDTKSLMFGMPRVRDKNYGYLEVSDVITLIVSKRGNITSEEGWRKELKELTLQKMTNDLRRTVRNSLPSQHKLSSGRVDDNSSSAASSPEVSIPNQHSPMNTPPLRHGAFHQRSVSETQGYINYQSSPRNFQQGQLNSANWSDNPVLRSSYSEFNQNTIVESEPSSEDDNSDLFQNPIIHSARQQLQSLGPPQDVPLTPSMAHPPSAKPAHPLPSPPLDIRRQARLSTYTFDTMVKPSPQMGNNRDYFGQPPDSRRESQESNLFDSLLRGRNQMDNVPPSVGAYNQNRPESRASNTLSVYGRYTPNPNHPLPAPPLDTSAQSQVAIQSPQEYSPPISIPPGYELQTSHILLAGPLPRGDRKTEIEKDYLKTVPSPQSPNRRFIDPQDILGQHTQELAVTHFDNQQRLSWVRSAELGANGRQGLVDISRGSTSSTADALPSPPIPAKIPLKPSTSPQIHSIQTNFNQMPVSQEFYNSPNRSTDSLGSLADHVIDYEALEKVGPTVIDSDQLMADEDTLDRKEAAKLMRKFSEAGSEYDNTVDDYASESEPEAPQPPPRIEGPRTGVLKVVGQKRPDDVIVGDMSYKPVIMPPITQTSGQTVDIPRIDFGKTMNHGRSLLATGNDTTKPVQREGAAITEANFDIHALGLDNALASSGHSRSGSGGLEKKRAPHSRQDSFEFGKTSGSSGSQGSDSDAQAAKPRNMAWQPGMVQPLSAKTVGRTETPEQLVYAQAVAASQEHTARNRYLHARKSSGNILRSTTPTPNAAIPRNVPVEAIPRPPSRGGNAAFLANGLMAAPDLHNNLSAREQEFVARYTGTPLLQLEGGMGKKRPPHQAGLLGAIESRERERRDIRDNWGKNPAIQHALAQRQHVRSPSSSRGLEPLGRGAGQQIQQSYFSQNPTTQPSPQQLQQEYLITQQQQGGFSQLYQQQQLMQQQQQQQLYGQYYGAGGR